MKRVSRKIVLDALNESLKYIPANPPLQEFVAYNPLWSLIDKSMYEATSARNHVAKTRSTYSIKFYWEKYNNNEIDDSFIGKSIAEFIDFHHQMREAEDSSATHLFKDLVFKFLSSRKYQEKLIYLESLNDSDAIGNSILLSKQIQYFQHDNLLDDVESNCLDWLAVYFNPSSGSQETVIHHSVDGNTVKKTRFSFFKFWWTCVCGKDKRWESLLAEYSDNAEEFVQSALTELLIPESSIHQYLFEICWQLKGWVGYIKWNQDNPHNPYANRQVAVIEVIAIWLAYELFWFHENKGKNFSLSYQVSPAIAPDNIVNRVWQAYIEDISETLGTKKACYTQNFQLLVNQLHWVWQRAYELSYQEPLYHALLSKQRELNDEHSIASKKRCSAQWIFCIDVRSEGFRRHLEQQGSHETFGFAGFFGVPHQFIDRNKATLTYQSPALLNPQLVVEAADQPQSFFNGLRNTVVSVIEEVKKTLLCSFALYEMVGLFFSIILVFKNFGDKFLIFFNKLLGNNRRKNNNNDGHLSLTMEAVTLDEMVVSAKSLLDGIGLQENFSKFVVICGHAATTENNPYQAALNCGACGGNSGVSNAVLACDLLNKDLVRAGLLAEGINIPHDTLFIPACHNTTTDKISWKSSPQLAKKDQALLMSIKKDAIAASESLQKERLKDLPGNKNVIYRSKNWAELIPEWGLVNNAAMIIAPRQLTQSLNLASRVFLHSYNNESDPNGEVLASILLGPLIVAHWINSQYYFSSLDPENYGAGNKAIHNVLPYVGVIEGNQSDLKYGLPKQSVFYQRKNTHQALRLCVFIDAKQEKINAIIFKHPVLKALVTGHWLYIKPLQR